MTEPRSSTGEHQLPEEIEDAIATLRDDWLHGFDSITGFDDQLTSLRSVISRYILTADEARLLLLDLETGDAVSGFTKDEEFDAWDSACAKLKQSASLPVSTTEGES